MIALLTAATLALVALLAAGAVFGRVVLAVGQGVFDAVLGVQHDGPEWDAR